jgi:hypothetical protein
MGQDAGLAHPRIDFRQETAVIVAFQQSTDQPD